MFGHGAKARKAYFELHRSNSLSDSYWLAVNYVDDAYERQRFYVGQRGLARAGPTEDTVIITVMAIGPRRKWLPRHLTVRFPSFPIHALLTMVFPAPTRDFD